MEAVLLSEVPFLQSILNTVKNVFCVQQRPGSRPQSRLITVVVPRKVLFPQVMINIVKNKYMGRLTVAQRTLEK
jgi:hypothetical protein